MTSTPTIPPLTGTMQRQGRHHAGTKPPSGPQPTSSTVACAGGNWPRTNGHTAASQGSSGVMQPILCRQLKRSRRLSRYPTRTPSAVSGQG